MNKIYKVVWSKVKNCYVVVSELAKNVITGGVKSAKVGKAPLANGLAMGALMAFVITGSAMAAQLNGSNVTDVTYVGSAKDNNLVSGTSANIIGSGVETITFKNESDNAVNTAMGGYAGKASITNVDKIVVNGNWSNVFSVSDAASVGAYYVNLSGIGSIEATDEGKKSQFFHGFAGDITVQAEDITLNNVGSAALAQVGNQKWNADPEKQVNHGSQIKIDVENNFDITTSQASSVIAAGNYNRVANDGYNPSVEITAGNMTIDAKNSTAFETYGGTWSVDEGGNVSDGTYTGIANVGVNVKGALNVDAATIIQAGNGTSKGDSSVNIQAGTINFTASDYVVNAYHNAAVNVAADTAVISGDVSAQGNSVVNLELGENGSLTGKISTDATSATTLDLGTGSAWNVTGDSTVSHITGDDFEITGVQGVARNAEGNSLTIVNDKNTGDVASNGIYSTGSATINNLKNLDVTSANRHAIEVATDMEIDVDAVKLTSNNGNGILAYGDLTVKANDMGILAQNGHGIRAAKDDGHAANVDIDVERLTIVAENSDETAVKVSDGALVSANASDTANINGQILAEVDSTVKLSGGTVNVTSVEDALDTFGGTIEVEATNINIKSTEKDGIQADDAIVTLKGENVTVEGKTYGIKNIAENDSSVVVNATNATIGSADGNNAIRVINAGGAGEVAVNATGTVNVNGEVLVELDQAVTLKGATVNVTSKDEDALDSWGGIIDVDATDSINITSENNDGIQANDANITLDAEEVNVSAEGWAIKNLDETNSKVVINATDVVIEGETGAIMTSENGQGEVTVNGTGTTTIKGDISAQSNGSVNVLLNNAESSLTGAVKTAGGATTTLTMNEGATWYATGESTVSVVAGNEGKIDVTDINGGKVTVKDNQNADLTVTKDAQGIEAATKENLTALKETVEVENGNEVSVATLTNAAIAGDVTMDAAGNVITTLNTKLNVTDGLQVKTSGEGSFSFGNIGTGETLFYAMSTKDGVANPTIVMNAQNGNIETQGSLSVGNGAFVSDAASGNAAVQGSLAVGGNAAVAGGLNVGTDVVANGDVVAGDVSLKETDASLKETIAKVENNDKAISENRNDIAANREAIKEVQDVANKNAADIAVNKEAIKDLQDATNKNTADIAANSSAIQANKDAIDKEVADRIAADNALQDAIDNVVTDIGATQQQVADNTQAIENNAQAIVDEAANRAEADTKLQQKLDKESVDRQIEDAKERAERITADAKEEAARIEADAKEKAERIEADAKEAQARQEADAALVQKFTDDVGRLDNRIDKVEDRVDKVGAMAAAMASLRTMGYDPEAPTEIAVGIGQYRNETGIAIGAFHYPNKDFMLNFSLSTAGDEVMGGVGATWKIGRKKPEGNTMEEKVAKAEAMKEAAKAK